MFTFVPLPFNGIRCFGPGSMVVPFGLTHNADKPVSEM